MASPAPVAWTARPGCHAHLREALERHVNAHPAAWRSSPVTGEAFESLAEAEKRLHLYAVVKGCDIVRRGGGNKKAPAHNFHCIHHGDVTMNTRELEDRVVRDEGGAIIS